MFNSNGIDSAIFVFAIGCGVIGWAGITAFLWAVGYVWEHIAWLP